MGCGPAAAGWFLTAGVGQRAGRGAGPQEVPRLGGPLCQPHPIITFRSGDDN